MLQIVKTRPNFRDKSTILSFQWENSNNTLIMVPNSSLKLHIFHFDEYFCLY